MSKPSLLNAIISCAITQLAYTAYEKKLEFTTGLPAIDPILDGSIKLIKPLHVHPDGFISPLELMGLLTEDDYAYRINLHGTDSIWDWFTDGRIALEKTGFAGYVSAGVNDLALQILNQIPAKFPNDKPIIVGGHSLGAAVAKRLATLLERVDEIHSMGGQKFADQAFARQYAKVFAFRTLRIVNTADEVPKVPEDIPPLLELHHVCDPFEFYDKPDVATLPEIHALSRYQANLRRLVA